MSNAMVLIGYYVRIVFCWDPWPGLSGLVAAGAAAETALWLPCIRVVGEGVAPVEQSAFE